MARRRKGGFRGGRHGEHRRHRGLQGRPGDGSSREVWWRAVRFGCLGKGPGPAEWFGFLRCGWTGGACCVFCCLPPLLRGVSHGLEERCVACLPSSPAGKETKTQQHPKLIQLSPHRYPKHIAHKSSHAHSAPLRTREYVVLPLNHITPPFSFNTSFTSSLPPPTHPQQLTSTHTRHNAPHHCHRPTPTPPSHAWPSVSRL